MIERCNYLIEPIEYMGGGTFGSVYKVNVYNRKKYLCGQFAMKTMKYDARETDEFRQRFIREGHLQSKCAHKNIVPIYICKLEGIEPWFVMELGEIDVEKLIISDEFPRKERLNCIIDLLYGMEFIHSRKLLHRDIKPSNMVKVGNDYKIADFGLVKNTVLNANSAQLTAIGQAMGTPGFLAPEAVFGHYSDQTDIYAIGTFLEFTCHNEPHLLSKLLPIINKCREHIPANRYQSVSQILDIFIPIYNGEQNA